MPWESSWTKLVVWGVSFFVVAVLAAYLRHWQRLRVARAEREASAESERGLREEWARLVHVVGGENDSVRLAAPTRKGAFETLPGVVLELPDGTRGALRVGIPLVGLGESGVGSSRSVTIAPDEPFWIAAKPTEIAARDLPQDAGSFRETAWVPELEPYDGVYRCGIGEPPRLREPLPELPRLRPWGLVGYLIYAGVVAAMPLEAATPMAIIGSGLALVVELSVTLGPFVAERKAPRD